jgi:coatomer protein complex subunit gamma
LGSLCDFIEDCEFMPLLVRVLNVLGDEAPKTEAPAKFLRHVANRIILENATVRCVP